MSMCCWTLLFLWTDCCGLHTASNSAPAVACSPLGWDGEENRKNINPMGGDKNSLITKVHCNTTTKDKGNNKGIKYKTKEEKGKKQH